MEIPNAPATVTVVVTSGTFGALARIVVVPGPTEVTGIRIEGALLPSQMKIPVGCMVATPGSLELRFTIRPSMGAVALSLKDKNAWFPIPVITVF